MGSLSNEKVRKLKRELVAELVVPQGAFGKGIWSVRDKFGITPVTQLPSPDFVDRLGGVDLSSYPAGVPKRGYMKTISSFDVSNPSHLKMLYCELSRIYHLHIPEEYRDERVLDWNWSNFFVACVFYDPPDTQLLQFAAYDDPPSDPAPIRWLPEAPEKIVYAERRLWLETIAEIERHNVGSSLARASNLIAEVWDRNPHIEKERHATWETVQHRHYIEVNEDTTEADVRRAFSLIKAKQEERHKKHSRGGRPPRDPLTALQCAILYDRHNERDPQDRRRWKWTYEKLAKELGLPTAEYPTAESAEAYVQEGRKLLQDKP